jgi:hypothetical protein
VRSRCHLRQRQDEGEQQGPEESAVHRGGDLTPDRSCTAGTNSAANRVLSKRVRATIAS